MWAFGTGSIELNCSESNRSGNSLSAIADCYYPLSWGVGVSNGKAWTIPARQGIALHHLGCSAVASFTLLSSQPCSLLAIARNSTHVCAIGSLRPLSAGISPKYGSFLIIQTSDLCIQVFLEPPRALFTTVLSNLFCLSAPLTRTRAAGWGLDLSSSQVSSKHLVKCWLTDV